MSVLIKLINYLFAVFWLCGLTIANLNNGNAINPHQKQYRVKVFFPIAPQLSQSFTDTRAVLRTTPNLNVANFAIEQLIKGPTLSERQAGLIAPIELTGQSICGGNFKIVINRDVAKLQFCRTVVTGGIGDDARLKTSIEQTLTQFSTVDRVVILNKNGRCLNDLKGDNSCQKNLP